MRNDVTSTLSKPRNACWKRCCRRSSGLTFMVRARCSCHRPALSSAYRLGSSPGRQRRGVSQSGRGRRKWPSHPHQGGAFLDGDLEIVAHAHRELGQHGGIRRPAPAVVAERPQRRESRAGRASDRRRPAAAASARPAGRRRSARAASRIGRQLVCARPVLGRFAGQIDLNQQLDRAVRGRAPPRRACRRSARIVERVDASKCGAAFRALFDCRWPIRCQRSGRSAGLRPSSERFLNLVLAEVESVRRRRRRGRSRRRMSWRRRRGGWRRGRVRPGRRRARCDRERRPAGRGARRNRTALFLELRDQRLGRRGVRSVGASFR